MKIKFIGYKEQGKKGCVPCGRKATSGHTFIREKKEFLPTGRTINFSVGYEYEVNQREGEFLLERTLDGQSLFEEVK